MWRKQDEPKPSPPPVGSAVPTAVSPESLGPQSREPRAAGGSVSEAIFIKGEISGREDLYIDGEVQGSINLTDGNVTIGPKGRVTADIEAREILIRGKATGNLRGHERVQIARSGEASGDIVTRRIAVEDGAIFRGAVEIVRGEEARKTRATGTEAVRPISVRPKEEKP